MAIRTLVSIAILIASSFSYADCATVEQLLMQKRGEASQIPPANSPLGSASTIAKEQSNDIYERQLKMLLNARSRLSKVALLFPPLVICEAQQINARAFPASAENGPNGLVALTSAMLDVIGEDENMAASVLAHEVAHIIEAHSAQKQNQARRAAEVGIRVGSQVEEQSGRSGVGVLVARQIMAREIRAFSRDIERRADDVGYQMYVAAGYDPRAATRMFNALRTLEGDRGAHYLDTHPGHSERIARLESLARDDIAKVQRIEAARAQETQNWPWMQKADDLFQDNQWRDLAKHVEDWLSAMPESGQAWHWKGVLLNKSPTARKTAWGAFEKAVTYDPTNRDAWLALCRSLFVAGYKGEAAACGAMMQGSGLAHELKEGTYEDRLFVHGRSGLSPAGLWWGKTDTGSRLITNDRSVLERRGHAAEEITPTWKPVR